MGRARPRIKPGALIFEKSFVVIEINDKED
jgi:hypothetical protein